MNWIKGQPPSYILLALYYLAILITLIIMYGRADFSTPPFVYQGF